MNIKQIFRIVFRNKTYSLLNIFGLALGIASAALILLWAEDELTFDRGFSKSDRLYILGQFQKYGDKTAHFYVASNPMAEQLLPSFPEVERVTRYIDWGQYSFSAGDDIRMFEVQGRFADSTIFDMLDIKLVKGDPQRVFEAVDVVALSEAMAKKLFGDEDPIGKTIKMDNKDVFRVTGIFREPPKNSSFSFQWLIPFEYKLRQVPQWKNSWPNNFMTCFVELKPGADVEAINRKLMPYMKENELADYELHLYPIVKLHLYDEIKDGKYTGSGAIRFVKLFTGIACIILLIACINFMNLSTARSQKRALEVGVKKTFGAKRGMLVSQFMKESALITVCSLLLAVFIVWLALPAFNQLVQKSMTMQLFKPVHLLGIIGVGIFCALMAGSYPAFYLSSFNPMAVLKKLNLSTGSAAGIRKGLVVFQFTAAYVLICITFVLYLQIRHLQNRPLGYDKEQVIRITTTEKIRASLDAVCHELQNTGAVVSSAWSNQPIRYIGNNGGGYQWQGKDPNVNPLVSNAYMSPGMIETMGFRLSDGRDFYPGDGIDASNVIINRRFADLMGTEGRVGGVIEAGGRSMEIVGIIDDFVFDDLLAVGNKPVIFGKAGPLRGSFLFVRMNPQADIREGLSKIEGVIKPFNPGKEFAYTFMDDDVNAFFKQIEIKGILASLFAVLTVIIACLGLFGLSAYSAEQRTKEIGIRKVLGAGVFNLTKMLIRNFLLLVGISFAVGIPVAWYFSSKLLQIMEYRIGLSWWIFVAVSLLLILISILTTGFQSVRAATANPLKSIKTEE